MSIKLPNGAKFFIGSATGPSLTITTLTNATEAVATVSSGTTLTAGDIVAVASGWSNINGKPVRVKSVSTNDITLEKLDTSNTSTYPTGGGIGTLQEATTFVQITQVLSSSTSGGDQQFAKYTLLEEGTEHQIPTNKSAQSLSLTIGDDVTLPHYAILSAADQDRVPRIIKVILSDLSVILYNAYVTLNPTPSLTVNEVMALTVTLSFAGPQTRYVS